MEEPLNEKISGTSLKRYSYPYPAQGQGCYQGPPVQAPPLYYAPPHYDNAPPQYYAPSPPETKPGFLEGWLAGLRWYCLINECIDSVG